VATFRAENSRPIRAEAFVAQFCAGMGYLFPRGISGYCTELDFLHIFAAELLRFAALLLTFCLGVPFG
jgi:hypothetical protein